MNNLIFNGSLYRQKLKQMNTPFSKLTLDCYLANLKREMRVVNNLKGYDFYEGVSIEIELKGKEILSEHLFGTDDFTLELTGRDTITDIYTYYYFMASNQYFEFKFYIEVDGAGTRVSLQIQNGDNERRLRQLQIKSFRFSAISFELFHK